MTKKLVNFIIIVYQNLTRSRFPTCRYSPTCSQYAIEAIETTIKEQEKEARKAQNKADAIGASVFDLKAVNPNVLVKLDARTPAEVIQSIEDQGMIVGKSLAALRVLLQT